MVPSAFFRVQQLRPGRVVDRALTTPRFTERQGQYLAFIYMYGLVNGRPPAVRPERGQVGAELGPLRARDDLIEGPARRSGSVPGRTCRSPR